MAFLDSSDFVLSTALHEFQGLAVLESVALGCVPVLPNRQVYPELFGDEYLYQSDISNPKQEAKYAVDLIQKLIENKTPAPQVNQYQSDVLLSEYETLIQRVGR